jgi:predicted ATPase
MWLGWGGGGLILRAVEIQGYRSLHQVRLDRLGQINVLVGRNNTGKTAVFSALEVLADTTKGNAASDWSRLLTNHDLSTDFGVRLSVELVREERTEFIDLCVEAGASQRRDELLGSPFMRKLEFTLSKHPGQADVFLSETRALAEDSKWATIQIQTAEPAGGRREHRVTPFHEVAAPARAVLDAASIDVTNLTSVISPEFTLFTLYNEDHQGFPSRVDQPLIRWPFLHLTRMLSNAFFLAPYRHDAAMGRTQVETQLAPDGSNLAQVLYSLPNNDRPTFDSIEHFVHLAVPDLGLLHTHVEQTGTRLEFLSPTGGGYIAVSDMGGGIEQLLMIATALKTTGPSYSLFLEEPEGHLHPGAQRFLIEELRRDGRQVFLSTHSSVFVNQGGLASVYRVSLHDGRTNIVEARDVDELAELMREIGVRNSDVLMSDAALFVEGPSDADTFHAWSRTLGISLAENNINVISTGGGEFAERSAPARSDLLAQISKRAPVPHLFIIDRDERQDDEVERLHDHLGEHLHILKRRELENYLLAPRAIREAMTEKYRDNSEVLSRLEQVSDADVEMTIREAATGLYQAVLLRRLRSAIPGLRGGMVSRELVREIESRQMEDDLGEIITAAIKQRFEEHLHSLSVPERLG